MEYFLSLLHRRGEEQILGDVGAHPKRSKDSDSEKIYWVKATGRHWTLCREDDPEYALGVFESEERAVQAAQYLARHVSGGRVRVIQPGGIWETKYRHTR